LIWLLLACAGNGDTGVCVDTYQVTWENWGEGFFTTYCQSCHSVTSSDRLGAPEGIDFDTEEDLITWRDSVERVVLENQTMPVGGGVYEEDLLLLEMLLSCGLE